MPERVEGRNEAGWRGTEAAAGVEPDVEMEGADDDGAGGVDDDA